MNFSFFSEHYINPLTVFGINRLFNTESNKDLLIDFLNAIIGLTDKNRICDVRFLKPEQLDTMEIDKKNVFDVYCKTERDEYIIVEMYNEPAIFFWDRKFFYSAFPIRDQILSRKKMEIQAGCHLCRRPASFLFLLQTRRRRMLFAQDTAE